MEAGILPSVTGTWGTPRDTLRQQIGGGAGIRTLDTSRYAGFQDQCFQPLSHPSEAAISLDQQRQAEHRHPLESPHRAAGLRGALIARARLVRVRVRGQELVAGQAAELEHRIALASA